ncbi:MAG: aldose epimerase family protein [Spirochaetia bacterium]
MSADSSQEIHSYWLKSPLMEIEVLNLGAIIRRWRVLNQGQWQDICLGYEDVENYRINSPYLGAVIGRVAGRIGAGRFHLDGQKCQLECNNGSHHLHGGNRGFSHRFWQCQTHHDQKLVLTYHSPDGEEQYPGNLDVRVNYQLIDEKTLMICYAGCSDQDTLCDLTQHSYFNLSKDWHVDALGHKLLIPADKYGLLDETGMVNGELADVGGTPFDFRQARMIGNGIDTSYPQIKYAHGGYDHPFKLLGDDPIHVSHAASGLGLSIKTDMPYAVFYTSNFLNSEEVLFNGHKACPQLGICLETQHMPNAINFPEISSPKILASQNWQSSTTFQIQFYDK